MDTERYIDYQNEQFEKFEALCKRCGKCCGAEDEDPCARLVKDSQQGNYFCNVYQSRLGPQNTVSGNPFTCIPIQAHIQNRTLREGCAYWATLK